MIRAEGSVVIERSPRQVLEYILDLDRYRRADAKITRVSEQPVLGSERREGRARYRGRLRLLPTPSQWQTVRLTPWERLELRTEPKQWTAHFARFVGGFICEGLSDDETRLTHFEEFDFRAPVSWVMDRYLGQWMQRYLDQTELPQLKALIEAT
jgi:hypothetical protein